MRTWILGLTLACVTASTVAVGAVPPLPPPPTAERPLIPPQTIAQGRTLMLSLPEGCPAVQASLAGKTVRLFPQPDGTVQGWVPVAVTQKAGAYTLTLRDTAGDTVATAPVTVLDGRFPRQNITVSKQTKGLEPLPGEMAAIGRLKTAMSETRLWSTPFHQPTPDCQNSPFGVLRFHKGQPTGDYHKGVDLRSPSGRPIVAPAGGRVVLAEMFRLHGGTVGLDHGQGVTSVYIHQSRIAVKPGQQVKAGEPIGYVGSTGFATGPHLHWGLYVHGVPVDPTPWMAKTTRCG